MYIDDDILLRNLVNDLTREYGKSIIVHQTEHTDNYPYEKVKVNKLLKGYNNDSVITRFCKDFEDKNEHLKITDLLRFFKIELHEPEGKYRSNHMSNKIGNYPIYMPRVYNMYGVKYKNYLPILSSFHKNVSDTIMPKRSEFMIANVIYNYVNQEYTEFIKYLKPTYQENIMDKKFDICVGQYICIEVHENSTSHTNNINDIDKKLIAGARGMEYMAVLVSKVITDSNYIDEFLGLLKEKIETILIVHSPEFRNKKSITEFQFICSDKVKHINQLISMTSDKKEKNLKKIEKQSWESLIGSDKNTIISELFDYRHQSYVGYITNHDMMDAYVIPESFVLRLFSRENTIASDVMEHIKDNFLQRCVTRNNKEYIDWDGLADLINSISIKKIEFLKNCNFKLLLMTQKIYDKYTDKIINYYNKTIEMMNAFNDKRLKELESKHERFRERLTKDYKKNIAVYKERVKLYDSISCIIKSKDLLREFTQGVRTYYDAVVEVLKMKRAKSNIDNAVDSIRSICKTSDNFDNTFKKIKNLISWNMHIIPVVLKDRNITECIDSIDSCTSYKDQKSHLKNMKSMMKNVKENIHEFLDMKNYMNKHIKVIEKVCDLIDDNFDGLNPIVKISSSNTLVNFSINISEINKSIIVELPDFPIVFTDNKKDGVPVVRMLAIIDKGKYNIHRDIIKHITMNLLGLPVNNRDYIEPDIIRCIKEVSYDEPVTDTEVVTQPEAESDTETESESECEAESGSENACDDFDKD
jgi:hypothetical protein